MRAARGSPVDSSTESWCPGRSSEISLGKDSGTALTATSPSGREGQWWHPSIQGLVAAEPCTERMGGSGRRHPPFGPFRSRRIGCPERRNGPRCRGPFARQGRSAARYGSAGGVVLVVLTGAHVVTVGSQLGSTIPSCASIDAWSSALTGSSAVVETVSPSAPSAQAASLQAASLQAASLQAAEPQAAEAQAASDHAALAQAADDQAASAPGSIAPRCVCPCCACVGCRGPGCRVEDRRAVRCRADELR